MSTKKRNKPYTPKPVSALVTKALHDEIALGMRIAYQTLATAPDDNAFCLLARIFNMVGLAAEGEPRFAQDMIHINSGAAAMNQIGAKTGRLKATPFELLSVRNAVNAIDALLPRLDIVRLHHANLRLQSLE